MATTIVTKNSSTASAVPLATDLVQGELAVNVTDKRLFTENSGGTVVELGTNPSSITTSSATITGGTINSTSVGATTASTGAFTTLSASSTLGVTGTATFSGALVANGNTTIGNADTDTITQVASYVTGTQLKSAKTATNTLNLAAYDVDGAAYTNLVTLTASNTPTLALTSTGVGTINNMSIGATTASTGAFTTLSASSTVSGTGFSTYLASPPAIGGTTPAAGTFTTLTSTGNTVLGDASTDTLNVGNGGLVKDASGNVGIGTSSPATTLNVVSANTAGTDNLGNVYIRTTDAFAADVGGKLTLGGYYNGSATYAFGGIAGRKENATTGNVAGYLQLSTTTSAGALTERARIDSSGSLQVGTTSANSARLSVFGGTGSLTTGVAVQNGGGVGNYFIQFFNSSGSGVGSISQNGASTTAYNTSSDYRLKEDIAPMTGALARIAALKPVTYKWKVDGSDGEGFIAHELQAVVPDCVTGEKDAVDADGNPIYQGIDTSFLVATLTAAIQELKAIVDAQAVEIAALKGQA